MSDDYKKEVYGGNTDIVSNPVECQNASLSSSHSGTLEFRKITCEKDATINADHSATLVIDTLICENATINIAYFQHGSYRRVEM
jgi:hypothetical protein